MKTLTHACVALAALGATLGFATPASAQEPMLGEVRLFGFNYCPRGWARADGQLLPIASNSALFSLYGTFYGGDGRTTFALPDLRGRAPVHAGRPPGRPAVSLGQQNNGAGTAAGDNATTTATLGMQYCVALQGVYPSRG